MAFLTCPSGIDRSLKKSTHRSYSFSWNAKKLTDLLIQLYHFGTHYIQSGLGWALVFSFSFFHFGPWWEFWAGNWYPIDPFYSRGLSFRNRRKPFNRWPIEVGAPKSQPGLELVSAKVLYTLEGDESFTSLLNYHRNELRKPKLPPTTVGKIT